MFDLLINTHKFPLILLGIFSFAILLQLFFYWILFWRLGHKTNPASCERSGSISVVICARNEYRHLAENLPLILEQDYPDFEVLVVDHSSDDDTHYLLTSLQEKYLHLKNIVIREDLNFFTGKKFPLSIGIKSAKYDMVVLTDADCKPASKDWLARIRAGYTKKTEIVLGYGAYNRSKGLLNKLIRFDTAHIAMQYLSYASAGIPYMGVGRNLSYLKQLFYKNNGFISHYQVRSGDDDLFINRVASRSNTAVVIHPDSFTYSDPKQTADQWITQKRRHLSTSNLYRFRHKLLLGLYSLSLLLSYLGFILLLAFNWSVYPVLGIFLLRLVSQYVVYARCMKKLKENDLVLLVPFYEIILLLFNAAILVSNVFHKPARWK